MLESDLDYVKRLSEKAPNGWGKCAKDALAWWEENKPLPQEPPPIEDDGEFPTLEGEGIDDGPGTPQEGNEATPASPEAYDALFAKAAKADISREELDTESQIRYGRPCDELMATEVKNLSGWIG